MDRSIMDMNDNSNSKRAQFPAPPVAEPRPFRRSFHGIEISDDYAWLRADNWQEVMRKPDTLDAGIRAYLEAENAYTAAQMADTEALQATLFAEMKARIKEDDSSVPAVDGPWAYYSSYVTGGEYPLICRRPRDATDNRDEQVLLDGNAMGAGLAFFNLGAATHSHDHRLLAYAIDTKGSEFFTIRIRDLETGTDLPDEIADSRGGAVWASDNQTLFYTRLDENHRPFGVFRHRLGTPAESDALIFKEDDAGFFVGVGATRSKRYILIDAHDHETSEVYLIDADHPEGEPRLIAARRSGHEYSVEHVGDRLIILSNADGAEDFKIVEAPTHAPQEANWREIEPHRPGRLILDMAAFAGHIVRLERFEGLPRIIIRQLSDNSEHEIAFTEEAYSLGMSAGYEFDTTALRFNYSSMTTPTQVYDYDMATRQRLLRKTQEVPSGHTIADYVTRRILAPADDGELVPVSLIYHRSTPLDGSAPLLLYGYGSYGLSIPAAFATSRLSLVDRGFVYAIAHVRGGKDKGYRWYKDGKREKKTNTFTDFIAAGRHLISAGFTSHGRIVAQGGSAGGMLMGAVANLAPDLFAGIIAQVPFVDVLNTMLDDSLPLTPPEWPEWGNPIASREAFALIRAYAPYEQVSAQAYPPILAMGGLTDPRVTYWEPAKWVAKLRATKTNDSPLLLKINMDAGHQGASGRFEHLKEVALCFAFALKVSGSTEAMENAAA